MPEENASTKYEFEHRTELIDPVDGRIWRWEREIEVG